MDKHAMEYFRTLTHELKSKRITVKPLIIGAIAQHHKCSCSSASYATKKQLYTRLYKRYNKYDVAIIIQLIYAVNNPLGYTYDAWKPCLSAMKKIKTQLCDV